MRSRMKWSPMRRWNLYHAMGALTPCRGGASPLRVRRCRRTRYEIVRFLAGAPDGTAVEERCRMRSLALLALLATGCLDSLIPAHKQATEAQVPEADMAEAPQPSDPPAAEDAGHMMM